MTSASHEIGVPVYDRSPGRGRFTTTCYDELPLENMVQPPCGNGSLALRDQHVSLHPRLNKVQIGTPQAVELLRTIIEERSRMAV
jgi:hypothetical protein